MANPRQFDLEDILIRPGTYFNPQTEVLVVIDDSPDIDTEVFNMEDFEGADWVLISDEVPIDGDARDELMQAFQVRHGSTLVGDIHTDDESSTTTRTPSRRPTSSKTSRPPGRGSPHRDLQRRLVLVELRHAAGDVQPPVAARHELRPCRRRSGPGPPRAP